MTRKVFYTFRHDTDSYRVQQVKNMDVVEGQPIMSANEWEDVQACGDRTIPRWIGRNMSGASCDVVLIGSSMAGREWVDYEIGKAWEGGRRVVGIHIHNLQDLNQRQSVKRRNPFADFTVGSNRLSLGSVAKAHDPPYVTNTYVYPHIAGSVEEAIEIRRNFR